jgi:hypothetical protein
MVHSPIHQLLKMFWQFAKFCLSDHIVISPDLQQIPCISLCKLPGAIGVYSKKLISSLKAGVSSSLTLDPLKSSAAVTDSLC